MVGWLILAIVSLGTLAPRFSRERYRFIMSRSRFGATSFECNPGIGRFYQTAFGAIGLTVLVWLIVLLPGVLLTQGIGSLHELSPSARRSNRSAGSKAAGATRCLRRSRHWLAP